MAVRSFDVTDDSISLGPGALPAASAETWVAIVKLTNNVLTDRQVFLQTNAASPARTQFGMRQQDGAGTVHMERDEGSGLSWSGSGFFNASMGWALIAVTRAGGSGVTARWHRYRFDLDTWSHIADPDFTTNNSANTPTSVNLGRNVPNSSGELDGKLAVVAAYDYALSDAQVESLVATLSTADFFAVSSAGADPVAAWELNQAAVTDDVLDLTAGGADQTGRVGTTVVTDDDPPGWTFGLEGAEPQILRPDADTTTTGWTATPLHSKLSDESDGTVITATLS